MRLVRRIALTATMLVLVASSGCGSGSAVAPKTWARSVCTALSPWRGEIASLTGRVQGQMASTTTPAQARQSLVGLLAGAEDASEVARRRVEAAGTPDVAEGAEIAARFVASLRAARDAYAHAKAAVSELATADAKAFYDEVSAAFGRLSDEYAQSALDTRTVDSAELRRAFDEVPECH